jgi:GTP pyrophosphokinase
VFQKVRPPRSSPSALDKIIKEIRSRRPKADVKLVERAFELADEAHAGQLRKSGDPFISHPLNVAQLLA